MAPKVAVSSVQSKSLLRSEAAVSPTEEQEALRKRNDERERELKKSLEREEMMKQELRKTWHRLGVAAMAHLSMAQKLLELASISIPTSQL